MNKNNRKSVTDTLEYH